MSITPSFSTTPDFDTLVAANPGLVFCLANEFRGRGVPHEDLIAEGQVGLIEAARRFDDARGAKFTTYAAWWIRKRILKALADQPRVVRVTSYRRKVERQNPTGQDSTRVVVVAFDDRPGEDRRSFGEGLADPDEGPERSLLQSEAIRIVRETLTRLRPNERRVLALRYGLDDDEGMTLREAGVQIGLSRERVRQIEARAMQRIRRVLLARHARRIRGAA